MKIRKLIKHIIIFFLLTVLTQIGGVVYLFSVYFSRKILRQFYLKRTLIFVVLYLFMSFLIVPRIAKYVGRERISEATNLKAANFLTVLLNRNYVTKKMNVYLSNVSNRLNQRNDRITILYLDACFPFIKGFPLLPHLSHNDGNKVDFSLVYQNENGEIVEKNKSISGYGVFENPTEEEFNQTEVCKKKGYFQYDYPKYLTIWRINSGLKFSEKGTKSLLLAFLETPGLEKLFIEPHLKNRMKLTSEKIRFHGCGAVRHDDHIHIQIKNN
ncbi:hypothetical protein EMN47_19220 [Prolixibacteraceae bacterium JC049]|nr:hypothetical protein [Prolixibacteraceae bacterium JC049]